MTHRLELFTHVGCISRRDGMLSIGSVLKDFPGISFREVDMVTEKKRAQKMGIRMSPTLVFNEKILVVGIPEREVLWKMLKEQICEHD